MSFIGHLATKVGLLERRRDARVPAREITASYWTGVEQKEVKIKNISPTGIYLLTDHRWLPGATMLLTLQGNGRKQPDSACEVRFRASVVRLGDDGAGLTFLHEYVDTDGWLNLLMKATALTAENDAVRVFRLAKALAFLLRVSPSAEERILKLLSEGLDQERAERALEIALRAEELVSSGKSALKEGVFPSLILRILTDGSKSSEEPMQECWSGLLAASAACGADDDENLNLCEALSRLEPIHLRILAAASRRAVQAKRQSGETPCWLFDCTMEEMKDISKTKNLPVIECALNRLCELGLLELTVKQLRFESLDRVNLTPTASGVKLYTRCSGEAGGPRAANCTTLGVAS